jgi:hypothetical protein
MMTPDASRIRPGEGRRLIVQTLYSSEHMAKIKAVFGHRDVKTKMIYTDGLHLGPAGVRSPLDGAVSPFEEGCYAGPPNISRLRAYEV